MKNKKFLILTLSVFTMALFMSIPISNSMPSWSDPIRLTNHGGSDEINIQGCSMVIDAEGKLHAVSYYGGQIYYIYDNQGFINETTIATGASAHGDYTSSPVIGIDSNGTIHVVYYASDGSDYELFYTHSTGDGSFITPIQITDNTIADDFPQMVIDSNDTIHIAYQTGEILDVPESENDKLIFSVKYIYSTGVETFSAPIQIIKPDYADIALSHRITVDNNNYVHIVYEASEELIGGYSIVYTNNTNGSFDSYDIINQTSQDFWPDVKVGQNDIAHIVFRGAQAGGTTQDIFYANNSAGSFNDTVPVKLSSVTYVEGPRLLISDNNTINIVFYGFNETWDSDIVRLLWVDNSTGSFSQESIISEQEYDQVYPCMVFDSDENIHILYLYGQSGNEDVYYITNADYYPVGVGPPYDPTFLLIIVGVIGGAAAVSAFTFLYRRFKKAERELWEPKLDNDDNISYD